MGARADAVVIVTEWNAFRALDLDRLRRVMSSTLPAPVLVDLRNIYDPDTARGHGFTYRGVGRGTPSEPRASVDRDPLAHQAREVVTAADADSAKEAATEQGP